MSSRREVKGALTGQTIKRSPLPGGRNERGQPAQRRGSGPRPRCGRFRAGPRARGTGKARSSRKDRPPLSFLPAGRRACHRGPGRRAPRQPEAAVTPPAPRSRAPPPGLRASPSSPPGRRARPATRPGAARASSSPDLTAGPRATRGLVISPLSPGPRPTSRKACPRCARPQGQASGVLRTALPSGLRSPRASTGPCWTETTTKGESR